MCLLKYISINVKKSIKASNVSYNDNIEGGGGGDKLRC